jgi:calcium-dependent protein kinase
VLQKCDHPHIIRLYEAFEDNEHFSMVMELCLGGNLVTFSHADAELLTEGTSAVLVRHMLSAVGHLHSQEVCHGELTLECFVFTRKIGRGVGLQDLSLKLVNVGRAHHAAADGADASMSDETAAQIKARARKHGCMAPEQLKNVRVCTPKCDVWAVGAIAFFLSSGSWPVVGSGDHAKLEPQKAWTGISSCGRDHVTCSLAVNPEARPEVQELLGSPWMAKGSEAYAASAKQGGSKKGILEAPLVNAPIILQGFKNMAKLNDLERASMMAVAHYLPEEKIAHLRKAFEKMDLNGDGVLTPDEISQGLQGALTSSEQNNMTSILTALDTDGNGSVDYTEFIAATYLHREGLRDEVCEAAFRMFDNDGSGTVSVDELKQYLAIGGEVSRDVVSLLEEIDKDGSGEIDLEEFKQMLRGHMGEQSKSKRRKGSKSPRAGSPPSPRNKSPAPKAKDAACIDGEHWDSKDLDQLKLPDEDRGRGQPSKSSERSTRSPSSQDASPKPSLVSSPAGDLLDPLQLPEAVGDGTAVEGSGKKLSGRSAGSGGVGKKIKSTLSKAFEPKERSPSDDRTSPGGRMQALRKSLSTIGGQPNSFDVTVLDSGSDRESKPSKGSTKGRKPSKEKT